MATGDSRAGGVLAHAQKKKKREKSCRIFNRSNDVFVVQLLKGEVPVVDLLKQHNLHRFTNKNIQFYSFYSPHFSIYSFEIEEVI